MIVDTGDASDLQNYRSMVQFAVDNDMADDAAFAELERRMDVENFALYFAIQIYVGNDDWPQNNNDLAGVESCLPFARGPNRI